MCGLPQKQILRTRSAWQWHASEYRMMEIPRLMYASTRINDHPSGTVELTEVQEVDYDFMI